MLEFVAFRERLLASHTRAVARCERLASSLRAAVTSACTTADGKGGGGNSSLPAALAGALAAAWPDDQALPWGQLPHGWPSNGRPTALATALRFNEDLPTRPGWFAPALAPAHLAPAEWWQAPGAGDDEAEEEGAAAALLARARGQCAWWGVPGAAESEAEPRAAAARAAQAAAVRARWCGAHALAHVLAGLRLCEAPGGAAPGCAPAAVREMARCLGWAPGGEGDDRAEGVDGVVAWVEARAADGSGEGACALLPLASCAVLAAGAASSTSGAASQEQPGQQRAWRAASAALRQAAAAGVLGGLQAAAAEGAALLPVLPGSVLASATCLLLEPAAWMVATLEVRPFGWWEKKGRALRLCSVCPNGHAVLACVRRA